MGKRKRRSDTFPVEREAIYSHAFQELSGTGKQVVLIFWEKRQWVEQKTPRGKEWVCANNGKINFTYGEAEKMGMCRSTFARALSQLVRSGFLDITHHGGGLQGDATLYAISERWRDYGKPNFIEKERPKDNRGLGFKKGHPDYRKQQSRGTPQRRAMGKE